jgi:hypothetical protein
VDPGCVDPGCCVPQCGRRCTPILDFIGDLFRKKPCHAPCCGPVQWVGSACCEPTCCPTTCGAAAPAYDEAAPQPAVAPEAAPAENGEQPGKLPAPKPNGQASVNFRSLIRN